MEEEDGITDNTAAVRVASWFLMIVSALAVCARLLAKWTFSRKFGGDDLLATLALLFSIGAGLSMSFAGLYGLGKSISSLDHNEISMMEKCLYAAEILYLVTLWAAKISIVLFFKQLFPQRIYQRVSIGLGFLITTLVLPALFAVVFQSSPPKTWEVIDPSINTAALWIYVCVNNIIGDIGLIVFPFYVLRNAQMLSKTKIFVLCCFGARMLDIVACATQIAYTDVFYSKSPNSDFTLDLYPWAVISQVVQTVTVITSCIPYLRQLLIALHSGLMMSDDFPRRGMNLGEAGDGQNERRNAGYVLRAGDRNAPQPEASRARKRSREAQNEITSPHPQLPESSTDGSRRIRSVRNPDPSSSILTTGEGVEVYQNSERFDKEQLSDGESGGGIVYTGTSSGSYMRNGTKAGPGL